MSNISVKFTKRALSLVLALILSLSVFVIPETQVVFDNVYAESEYQGSYYDKLNLNLKGDAFKDQLSELVISTHHTETTYSGLKSVYQKSDSDPEKSGNVILFYTGTSVKFNGFSGQVNREHVWPKAGGSAFPEKDGPGSDAHHIRPCDNNLNSSRGSMSFGEVPQTAGNIVKQNGSTKYDNLCYSSGGLFYPGEGYRGATARILMYVYVRWGEKYNLRFVDSAGSVKTIGKISDLMKWHLEEPPTEEEIRRNNEVAKIQGNRNPFIDHPEYAEKIFCYDGESYNSKLQSVVSTYGGYDTPAKDIESISFTQNSVTLTVGQTLTLEPKIQPAGASGNINWTSSNTSAVSVSNGVVTAKSGGNAVITASSAKNASIKASINISVKAISDITLSGSAIKTVYNEGDKFDPAGLSVTAVFSDGSTSPVRLADCKWVDSVSGLENLRKGTTSVICVYAGIEKTVSGIKVKEVAISNITVNRDSFNGSGGYAWVPFTSGALSGEAFMYPGEQTKIQMNSSKKSQYIYTKTPVDGINTVTVKLQDGSKEFELITSDKPIGQQDGMPSGGNSQGVKTVTTSGTTWTLSTSDKYFALVYKGTGVVYIASIDISAGTSTECRHSYGAWVAEVAATCTSSGVKGHYECSKCGELFDANKAPITSLTIDIKDHTFSEWKTVLEPTEDKDGKAERECAGCGVKEDKVIPAKGTTSDITPTPDQSTADAFKNAVNTVLAEQDILKKLQLIQNAAKEYNMLDAEVKLAVKTELDTLKAEVESYNDVVKTANGAHQNASNFSVTVFNKEVISK